MSVEEIEKTVYKLTRKQVKEALLNHIAMFSLDMAFFPFRVKSTNLDIPETTEVTCEYIPKGSKGTGLKDMLHSVRLSDPPEERGG